MDIPSPIIVTGLARSGTTLVQHILSKHPYIEIAGQTNFRMALMAERYKLLMSANESSGKENERLGYECPHYMYHEPERIHEFYKQYVYSMWRPRAEGDYAYTEHLSQIHWGFKHPWLSCNEKEREIVDILFHDTRWVICLRDPFKTWESIVNGPHPEFALDLILERWVKTCEFAEQRNAPVFTIDRLSQLPPINIPFRIRLFMELFEDLGLQNTLTDRQKNEVQDYIAEWPNIHRSRPGLFETGKKSFTGDPNTKNENSPHAVSPEVRQRAIESNPKLKSYMAKYGY